MHGGGGNGCCSPLRDRGSSGTPASRDRDRLRFKLSLEQCVCSVSNPSRTASDG